MLALILLAAAEAEAVARGGIAFHYATPLTPRQLEWYGDFDVLVTHDPLPPEQVDALHRRGTKLALYEWSVAFYESKQMPWQKRVNRAALLNLDPLRGHLGSPEAGAFYYDPATPEHERDRATMLVRRLRTMHYDGVFLDTTTEQSVHPEALAEFARRHPGVSYDEAFARFLKNLRKELGPKGIIVTNQGYRAAAHYLPYADWEVTESLITWPRDGKLEMRPWYDPEDPWNSTEFLMRRLIEPEQKAYPGVRFAHVNYLDTLDPVRVAEVVAIAKLFDAEAFVTLPSLVADAHSGVYFVDLGAPRSRGNGYRMYANGIVARGPARIRVNARYQDVVTGRTYRGRTIAIPAGKAVILRKVRG